MRVRTVCLIIVCFACVELTAGVWLIGAVRPAEIDMVSRLQQADFIVIPQSPDADSRYVRYFFYCFHAYTS